MVSVRPIQKVIPRIYPRKAHMCTLKAPKSTPPAVKQALILSWFHKSGVAHSIKDLEKALPSIASINGMLVKDYLQALSDDNKIRVEKIGSGNWYWSFPSEEKINKENALSKVKEDRDKAAAAVEELQAKVDEADAAREEDEDMLLGSSGDRKFLTVRHAELTKELEGFRKELATYSDNDPVELDRKKQRMEQSKRDAEKWTEEIQAMESWINSRTGGDREQMLSMKRDWYGDEFDDENGALKELW